MRMIVDSTQLTAEQNVIAVRRPIALAHCCGLLDIKQVSLITGRTNCHKANESQT